MFIREQNQHLAEKYLEVVNGYEVREFDVEEYVELEYENEVRMNEVDVRQEKILGSDNQFLECARQFDSEEMVDQIPTEIKIKERINRESKSNQLVLELLVRNTDTITLISVSSVSVYFHNMLLDRVNNIQENYNKLLVRCEHEFRKGECKLCVVVPMVLHPYRYGTSIEYKFLQMIKQVDSWEYERVMRMKFPKDVVMYILDTNFLELRRYLILASKNNLSYIQCKCCYYRQRRVRKMKAMKKIGCIDSSFENGRMV